MFLGVTSTATEILALQRPTAIKQPPSCSTTIRLQKVTVFVGVQLAAIKPERGFETQRHRGYRTGTRNELRGGSISGDFSVPSVPLCFKTLGASRRHHSPSTVQGLRAQAWPVNGTTLPTSPEWWHGARVISHQIFKERSRKYSIPLYISDAALTKISPAENPGNRL